MNQKKIENTTLLWFCVILPLGLVLTTNMFGAGSWARKLFPFVFIAVFMGYSSKL